MTFWKYSYDNRDQTLFSNFVANKQDMIGKTIEDVVVNYFDPEIQYTAVENTILADTDYKGMVGYKGLIYMPYHHIDNGVNVSEYTTAWDYLHIIRFITDSSSEWSDAPITKRPIKQIQVDPMQHQSSLGNNDPNVYIAWALPGLPRLIHIAHGYLVHDLSGTLDPDTGYKSFHAIVDAKYGPELLRLAKSGATIQQGGGVISAPGDYTPFMANIVNVQYLPDKATMLEQYAADQQLVTGAMLVKNPTNTGAESMVIVTMGNFLMEITGSTITDNWVMSNGLSVDMVFPAAIFEDVLLPPNSSTGLQYRRLRIGFTCAAIGTTNALVSDVNSFQASSRQTLKALMANYIVEPKTGGEDLDIEQIITELSNVFFAC